MGLRDGVKSKLNRTSPSPRRSIRHTLKKSPRGDTEASLDVLVLMKEFCDAQQRMIQKMKKATTLLGDSMCESEKAAHNLFATKEKPWTVDPSNSIYKVLQEATTEIHRTSSELTAALSLTKTRLDFAVQDIGIRHQQLKIAHEAEKKGGPKPASIDDYIVARVADITGEFGETCRDVGVALASQGHLLDSAVSPLMKTVLDIQKNGMPNAISADRTFLPRPMSHSVIRPDHPYLPQNQNVQPTISISALSEPRVDSVAQAVSECPRFPDDDKDTITEPTGFFWDRYC